MEKRISIPEVQPEAFKVMMDLEKYLSSSSVPPKYRQLIKIRASQMNSCAFCINMHTREARKQGETEQRIYLLNAWRESPQFSAEERIILAMTEEITLIAEKGLTEETYQQAIGRFGQEQTAQIIMTIVTINAWNRICVATLVQPD